MGQVTRICFLIDDLAPAGTESQLLALIRKLDRSRFAPYLVLLRGQGAASRQLEPDAATCPVLRLDVGSLRSPTTLFKAWKFVMFLRRERIDVVQAYFPDSSYFGVPAAWLAGVPHRIRTRNNIGHWVTPIHKRVGRAVNRFATGTIANCGAARDALIREERPTPESVAVLENGVDLDRFLDIPEPTGARNERPTVGVVANLRAVKGLDVLIDAVARLTPEFPRLRCVIAGEGEEREKLTSRIAAHGLSARVTLPGSCRDVPGLLATLDVAVNCSHAEGMSNAVLEYMAAARPVVATAVGATPELVADGRHGLLVPPGDPAALAEMIAVLLRDPRRAASLGRAARKRAMTRYSREAMVSRFEAYYSNLVAA